MKSWKQQDLSNKRVLLRTDINLPLEDGEPKKNLRFKEYMGTIQKLSDKGCKTVVLAHQGRPGREDFLSLHKHAKMMSDHLGKKADFISGFFCKEGRRKIKSLESGDVALMENIRFLSEELENRSPEEHAENHFVRRLHKPFDIFMNDAFSAAHRSHGSMVGFNQHLPSYAGPVMQREVENCRKAREKIEDSLLVFGGEKTSDIAKILNNMIGRAKKVLLGGIPGELALEITGHDLGKKSEWLEKRNLKEGKKKLAKIIRNHKNKIEFPKDLKTREGNHRIEELPTDSLPWDIGDRTRRRYIEEIKRSDSIVVKGPMGAYNRGFEESSKAVIDSVAESDGFRVLGGGHTSSLVSRYGRKLEEFSHVSIAGGAFVRFLGGEKLPAIEALNKY